MLIILFGCLAGISGFVLSPPNWHISPQIREVKLDESFKMHRDEMVQTADGKLRVRLKGIGRTISESGETEYVELQVQSNKSVQTIVISERGNRAKSIGNYIIKLVNAESFGETNCQLKISRKS